MSDIYKDPELNAAQDAFEKAVSKRQWSMIRERIVPRVMPPMAVSAVFTTTLFLDVWSHLPPQGRMVGMIAFAAAAIASPFVKNKAGSPLVSKDDAIHAIDKDIEGKKNFPALDFSDKLENNVTNPLWEASKKQIWNKWGDAITAQERKNGFAPYYGGEHKTRAAAHVAIACAAALSGTLFSDNLKDNWQTAMDWTVPIPPLVYTATIVPPAAISSLEAFDDDQLKGAMHNGQALQAHEQSILTIVAQDRPATIIINGNSEKPLEVFTLEELGRTQNYIYEITLDEGMQTIQIEDALLNLAVREDAKPSVTITGAAPDVDLPTSLSLQYRITDDTGAKEASGRMQITTPDGEVRSPVLESNRLPEIIILPYE